MDIPKSNKLVSSMHMAWLCSHKLLFFFLCQEILNVQNIPRGKIRNKERTWKKKKTTVFSLMKNLHSQMLIIVFLILELSDKGSFLLTWFWCTQPARDDPCSTSSQPFPKFLMNMYRKTDKEQEENLYSDTKSYCTLSFDSINFITKISISTLKLISERFPVSCDWTMNMKLYSIFILCF